MAHPIPFPPKTAAPCLWRLAKFASRANRPLAAALLLALPLSPARAAEGIMKFAYRGVWNGQGDLIGGAVMQGPGTTPVAARAVGPTLANYSSRPLYPDPRLKSAPAGQGFDMENQRWGDQNGDGATDSAADREAFLARTARAGMVDFASPGSLDAALAFDSPAGIRTFALSGPNLPDQREFLYEWANADTTTGIRAVNVSFRRKFLNGDKDMASFTLPQGPVQTVIIAASGPSLQPHVGSLPVLSDPVIALYEGAERLARNERWWDQSGNEATGPQIADAMGAAGLQPFLDSSTKDAALLVDLGPGVYSVALWGGLVGPQTDGEVLLQITIVD